jgi:hypothetical protein
MKLAIARDQFLHRSSAELFPVLTGADIATVIGPCGKPLGECSSADFASMAEWYRAYIAAGRSMVAEIKAQRALGDACIRF